MIVRTIIKSYKSPVLESYIDPKWEEVLATGDTKEEAWENYYKERK